MVIWDSIDTVLLDMDGTLLDLGYDNALWMRELPARYSETHAMSLESAERHLFAHMQAHRGRLKFYCLDYWATFTGIDIVGLHHDLAELIAYRPNAPEFLRWLATSGKRSVLVTNAHRASLEVKHRRSGLAEHLDAVVSCHDYGAPKESRAFWERLMAEHPFDPARALLIDDNASVLDAAADYGIAHLLTIAQPDMARPQRGDLAYPALVDFRDITPNGLLDG